jgi:hypothetical protein
VTEKDEMLKAPPPNDTPWVPGWCMYDWRPAWFGMHDAFVERTKKADIGVVFYGDSITMGWANEGKAVWERRYAPLKAVTYCIGGDSTRQLLWRIQHGEVNGIDFWGEPRQGKPGVHGRQVNKRIGGMEQGPVFARLSATNTWTALSGEDVLEEETTIRVYATTDHLRLLDVRVDLKALYGDVHFGGTKEAGPFAIRVAEGMKADNGGSFVNGCGGVEEKECWSKRAPWCDYFGGSC